MAETEEKLGANDEAQTQEGREAGPAPAPKVSAGQQPLLQLVEQALSQAENPQAALTTAQLMTEEVQEAIARAGSFNERDLIHYPNIIELVPQLENGSHILAIDYRTIPGNTSKVIPMDYELKMAEERGEISPETTPNLIVHSSGNASIWFTKIARAKGYNVVVVLPDYASTPRINALSALGAQIHFVRGELGVSGLIDRAKALESKMKGAKFLDQTNSPDNYNAFRPQGRRAARRLAINGITPTHLVAPIGTGGTFTGLTLGVQELVPECECIGVEVAEKPLLSVKYPDLVKGGVDAKATIEASTKDDKFWTETYPGTSQIPGMAANIEGENLTKLFNRGETENVSLAQVDNNTGLKAARLLGNKYQQFVGPSTGTAFAAALAVAESNPGSVVLMPVCDLGSQYDGDIWHREKRQIAKFEKKGDAQNGFAGSSIEVHDHAYAGDRTPHLTVKEMGGPLGTAAIMYMMEQACRDLECKLGLVDDTTDTVGIGFDTGMKHQAYIPMGTKLVVRAKLLNTRKDGITGKTELTFSTQLFALSHKPPAPKRIVRQTPPLHLRGKGVAQEQFLPDMVDGEYLIPVCSEVRQTRALLNIANLRERREKVFPNPKI